VEQVSEYKKLIGIYRPNIITNYRQVAENLVTISKMAHRDDKLCQLIKDVAGGCEFVVDNPASVGVVIFGFSDAEKLSQRHRLMTRKLECDAGLAVRLKGNANDLKLTSAVPRPRSHHG
jgi:hypothetical protein